MSLSSLGRRAGILVMGLVLLYLFYVAFRLQVEFFDTFQIFLNARSIASLDGSSYRMSRFMIPCLLFSPLALLEKLLSWDAFLFMRVCHLFSVFLLGLLLWSLYRLYRLHLSKNLAVLGTLLFALNPILIHYAPFSKEDIPATFFLTTGLYFYLRATQSKRIRDFAMTGALLGLAMGSRYNLLPALWALIIAFEFLGARKTWEGKIVRVKILTLLILPLSLFFLFPAVLYPAIGKSPLLLGAPRFVAELYVMNQVSQGYQRNSTQLLIFLWKSLTPSLIFCGFLGLILAWRKRFPGSLFHFLWLATFLLIQTYLIPAQAARNIFAFAPPLYFFVAKGVEGIVSVSKRFRFFWTRALAETTLLVALLVLPFEKALAECLKFSDPVYTVNMEREASRYAASLAEGHDIVWVGSFYAITPKDFLFDVQDEYTYFYHFYEHVVRFYTKYSLKKCRALWAGDLYHLKRWGRAIAVYPRLAHHVNDGDVLMINQEPRNYNSMDLPPLIRKALVVEKVRRRNFFLQRPDSLQGVGMFLSDQMAGAEIDTRLTQKGFEIRGRGVPDGNYELYLELPDLSLPAPFAFIEIQKGHFRVFRKGFRDPGVIRKVFLLYFDSVREFPIP